MSGSKAELSGHIQINVHFFEQGNVQLATNVKPSLSLPDSITVASSPQDIAKAVIKVISKAEEEYQLELNEAYRELSEKTFRSLRRALPVRGWILVNEADRVAKETYIVRRLQGKRWIGPKSRITRLERILPVLKLPD